MAAAALDESFESITSVDDPGTVMRKMAQKQRRANQQQRQQDQLLLYRGNTDWMSTVGAGVEPSVFLNHHQAHVQSRINEAKFRQTLS